MTKTILKTENTHSNSETKEQSIKKSWIRKNERQILCMNCNFKNENEQRKWNWKSWWQKTKQYISIQEFSLFILTNLRSPTIEKVNKIELSLTEILICRDRTFNLSQLAATGLRRIQDKNEAPTAALETFSKSNTNRFLFLIYLFLYYVAFISHLLKITSSHLNQLIRL